MRDGCVFREEVCDLLRDSEDGTFIVRDGADKINYTLTVRFAISINLFRREISVVDVFFLWLPGVSGLVVRVSDS